MATIEAAKTAAEIAACTIITKEAEDARRYSRASNVSETAPAEASADKTIVRDVNCACAAFP